MYESDDYAPVMSYYCPLPNLRMSAEQAQAAIEDTNCAVVNVKDEYGDWETVLALAGGGMDLSWDICEAYMLLGYLPPLHFCRLPRFVGWKLTAHRAWIIAGCNRSCPPCAQRMLAEGVSDYQRVTCFRLAVQLKKAGLPEDLAVATLKAWAAKNRPAGEKRVITEDEILAQVTGAYSRDYRSCGCGGPKVAAYCDPDCPLQNGRPGKPG